MGNCLPEKSREQEVPNIAKDGLADFRFSRDLIQWLDDASFGPSSRRSPIFRNAKSILFYYEMKFRIFYKNNKDNLI
jgi:hypothetical protein